MWHNKLFRWAIILTSLNVFIAMGLFLAGPKAPVQTVTDADAQCVRFYLASCSGNGCTPSCGAGSAVNTVITGYVNVYGGQAQYRTSLCSQ